MEILKNEIKHDKNIEGSEKLCMCLCVRERGGACVFECDSSLSCGFVTGNSVLCRSESSGLQGGQTFIDRVKRLAELVNFCSLSLVIYCVCHQIIMCCSLNVCFLQSAKPQGCCIWSTLQEKLQIKENKKWVTMTAMTKKTFLSWRYETLWSINTERNVCTWRTSKPKGNFCGSWSLNYLAVILREPFFSLRMELFH